MRARLRWFVGILSLASVTAAADAHAATYIVLSLVGNQITVVTAARGTGSNLDRNRSEVFPANDGAFDIAAVNAAADALRKIRPNATFKLLRMNDPKIYALQEKWLDSSTIDVAEFLPLLDVRAGDDGTTRVVLITRLRAEPQLATSKGHFGTGKVAGLGFYVNRFQTLNRSDTGERGRGYLGTFANFRMLLINPATTTVEAEETAAVGITTSAARAEDMDPWHALSTEGKQAALESLVRREVTRLVPLLLAADKQ